MDHARARDRQRRGGGRGRPPIDLDATAAAELPLESLLDLDAALDDLASRDERQAQVAELRCFCGLSMDEIAEALGVSVRTAGNKWRVARAWLASRLEPLD